MIMLGLDNSRNNSNVEHLYLKKEIGSRHTIRLLVLKEYFRKCKIQEAILISCPSGMTVSFTDGQFVSQSSR